MSTAKPSLNDRQKLADRIIARHDEANLAGARRKFGKTGPTPLFPINGRMPNDMAISVHPTTPDPSAMRLRKTCRGYHRPRGHCTPVPNSTPAASA